MDELRPHLSLVGMAGVGKSAIARRLAVRLGRPCCDIDAEVSTACDGRTIAEVFADIGEPGFRDLESAALQRCLASSAPIVIATGGGIVERAENRSILSERSGVIWLHATDEVLADRLRNSSVRRPLLEGDLESNLAELGDRRRHWYEEIADVDVRVGSDDIATTVERVVAAVTARWPELAGVGGTS